MDAIDAIMTDEIEEHSPSSGSPQKRAKRRRIGPSPDRSARDNATNIAEKDAEDSEIEGDRVDSEEELSEDDLGEEFEEEVEDAQDFDVEEIEYTIPESPERVIKLRLGVCKEPEFEEWLTNIHIRGTFNDKVVALAVGKLIYRSRISGNFWTDMEEPSQDMSDVAFELFDRYGYLRSKFKDHPVQRGSGAWGEELDNGPLLLIERTEVIDRELRRQGLGRTMVTLLLRKAEALTTPKPKTAEEIQFSKIWFGDEDRSKYSALHVLVIPGWLRADVEPLTEGKSKSETRRIHQDAHDSADCFYRALGFRRIGASSTLGYSYSSTHKTKEIDAVADFELPSQLDYQSDEEYGSTFNMAERKERMERFRQRLPLHHATVTLTDIECVAFYKTSIANGNIDWRQTNNKLDNVLHYAAREQKPESVKWLMENVDIEGVLTSARNQQGYTPLEALQNLVEKGRTTQEFGMMTLDVSPRFQGFSLQATDCMALLLGQNPQTVSKIDRQRLTYGCTCGECLEGFMSPRMVLALLFQAEVTNDTLDMDIGDGSTWCDWFGYMLTYVDADLRQNMRTNKSYRLGFKNMFGLMAECLRAKLLPVRKNILMKWEDGSEWPPVTRSYFQRGGTIEGKIEPALRIAFENAEDQGEKTGDGEYERTMATAVSTLKKCRNDDEFGFVASQCGLLTREGLGFGGLL